MHVYIYCIVTSTTTDMFPRLYSLLLAGLFTASLSIPTLLHTRYFITISNETWLILAIIEFVLVIIAQLCLMQRTYTVSYKNLNIESLIINFIFLPVTSSLTSLVFITLLSLSFLYSEYGNQYINIRASIVTLDTNALLSALHFQLLASIFGGVLFSLELYAELFRASQKDSILHQETSNKRQKGYRKSSRTPRTRQIGRAHV